MVHRRWLASLEHTSGALALRNALFALRANFRARSGHTRRLSARRAQPAAGRLQAHQALQTARALWASLDRMEALVKAARLVPSRTQMVLPHAQSARQVLIRTQRQRLILQPVSLVRPTQIQVPVQLLSHSASVIPATQVDAAAPAQRAGEVLSRRRSEARIALLAPSTPTRVSEVRLARRFAARARTIPTLRWHLMISPTACVGMATLDRTEEIAPLPMQVSGVAAARHTHARLLHRLRRVLPRSTIVRVFQDGWDSLVSAKCAPPECGAPAAASSASAPRIRCLLLHLAT